MPLRRRQDGLSLLYGGLARSVPESRETLRSRVGGKHILGVLGQSTFRRSLAALLWQEQGWRPVWKTDRVQTGTGEPPTGPPCRSGNPDRCSDPSFSCSA